MADIAQCYRCGHHIDEHVQEIGSRCNLCDCQCLVWPDTLEAASLALGNALSDFGAAVLAVPPLRWLAALINRLFGSRA